MSWIFLIFGSIIGYFIIQAITGYFGIDQHSEPHGRFYNDWLYGSGKDSKMDYYDWLKMKKGK